MKTLEGQWFYQSFTSNAAFADRLAGPTSPPNVLRPAQLAAPWTPRSPMEFTTDSAGVVKGSAKLGQLTVEITGEIIPVVPPIDGHAANGLPEGIKLTVTFPQTKSVYELQGYFIESCNCIVGTVVSVANDIGLQPVGTSGPFVLVKA